MTNKYFIGAVVLVGIFICGYQVGISTQSKTSIVETEKEVKQNNIITVIKEVKKSDGTVETVTTTTDKTKEIAEKKLAVSVIRPKNNLYHVSIAADTAIRGDDKKRYSLSIDRVIISNFSAGLKIDTDKNIGVVLGISF